MSTMAQRWSVPIRIDEVPETGRRFDLSADAAARAAVAAAANVEAIARLEAGFEVVRHGRHGLRVAGSVSARVRQTCVVTLEPMESEIAERIDLTFVPPREAADQRVHDDDPSAADPPEALVDGTVDLGAIATEFLILGIDPYPRKEGAVFAGAATAEAGGHPFDALAALKDRG